MWINKEGIEITVKSQMEKLVIAEHGNVVDQSLKLSLEELFKGHYGSPRSLGYIYKGDYYWNNLETVTDGERGLY